MKKIVWNSESNLELSLTLRSVLKIYEYEELYLVHKDQYYFEYEDMVASYPVAAENYPKMVRNDRTGKTYYWVFIRKPMKGVLSNSACQDQVAVMYVKLES